MSVPFDNTLRVRVPSALAERLREWAGAYARNPSDVVHEAIVLQLDRLSRRRPVAASQNDNHQPPEAA